jgi:tetratricopeptide (TPR) repeat protein
MDRMSRVSLFALFASLLLPVVAAAQVMAPPMPPPAPAALPAPAPQAPPPTPAAPARPPTPAALYVPPVVIDTDAIQSAIEAARAVAIDSGAIQEAARQASEEARAAMEAAREKMQFNELPGLPGLPGLPALAPMAYAWDMQDGFQGMRGGPMGDSGYSRGLSLLTQHQYENAITMFDRVIAAKSTHADGALYYKAWALSKLGRSDDAVAAINELKKSYASSPYLGEARTLEANVKKLGPDQVDDDDIKLLAIQAIQYSDPDKAVATCEGVLNGTNSLAVKQRAIYVLALIDRPEAHQLLLSYAKGKGNPELQREAITYLGARNAKQPTKSAELIDIYNSTSDVDVKMAVISAFRSAGDKASLMSIASGQGFGVGRGRGVGTQDAPMPQAAQIDQMGLRTRAISNLSDLASPQELWPLYQKEENKDLRAEWVSTFSSMGALDQLVQIVKTEKDPTVRQRAIRALGNQKSDKTGTMLTDLYAGGDKDTKEAVISAFGSQNNADGLIAIANKETDKDLRLKIVRQLVDMAPRSKAAADYLLTFIK